MPRLDLDDGTSETGGGLGHSGLRLGSITRGPAVAFSVDGRRLVGYRGETIACAMFANGVTLIRRSRVGGAPRGVFCAMGVCQECLLCDEHGTYLRSCVTLVEDGMRLRTAEADEAHTGQG